MQLIDIHTHYNENDGNILIINNGTFTSDTTNISIGIHPCKIKQNWKEEIQKISTSAINHNVKAIGECGIDLIKSETNVELQIEVLRHHIEISEKSHKPLILHIVKGQEIITRLRKETRANETWIIHGFRGKPEQAKQLIAAGFYLSYGTLFNENSLLNTPLDRILLERDVNHIPLIEHYKNIAKILDISIEKLSFSIKQNCCKCGIFAE